MKVFLNDIEDMESGLHFKKERFLRERGWTTNGGCHPKGLHLWEKEIETLSGKRTYYLPLDYAISIEEGSSYGNPENVYSPEFLKECEEHCGG